MAQGKVIDSVSLAAELIRRPSVTPNDAGAMELLCAALEGLGFTCRRLRFGEIENLYARIGRGRPNVCFAGHTDVVPPGPESQWTRSPFSGVVEDGRLHGRGAADMKAAIAAFIAAAAAVLKPGPPEGSISLLITGDEEGPALDGTRRVVETLAAEGEILDACIVGEPTSSRRLGDMIKIGRRGSLNATIEVTGIQGHVAYPDRAANPVPVLIRILDRLAGIPLDEGCPDFQPSRLEITDLEVGNPAANVIPPAARGRLNIRFNPLHTGASLIERIEREAKTAAAGFRGAVDIAAAISGEAFLTPQGALTDLLSDAVEAVVGLRPELSTTGGTSDARFIRALCPVVEFGLVGETMHKANEQVATADIEALAKIYEETLVRLFHS